VTSDSLFKFFFITFVVSWICFGLAAVVPNAGGDIFLLGVFMPALVAIYLTARADGNSGLQALFSRVFEWRVGVRWYVFAIGYMLAIRLAAALIQRVATGTWPQFSHFEWYVLAAAIVVSLPVQAGEEIGWRGYALPRLGAKLGYAGGSLLLGLMWAVWHLPTFFILPGNGNYGQSFPLFLVGVTAISVAMAWLYLHTNGSVLLAMLMHSAINQTHEIVQSGSAVIGPLAVNTTLIAWLTLALLWSAAAYFLIRMRAIRPSALDMALR
jgi:membrane protease YdiL (CAAX protease family)